VQTAAQLRHQREAPDLVAINDAGDGPATILLTRRLLGTALIGCGERTTTPRGKPGGRPGCAGCSSPGESPPPWASPRSPLPGDLMAAKPGPQRPRDV